MAEFYKTFATDLEKAEKDMRTTKEPTGIKCEKCEAEMLKRWGKNGFFLGCSNYPECDYTANVDGTAKAAPVETDEVCEKCGSKMLLRSGRYGQFLGCSGYPKCKNIKSIKKEDDKESTEEGGEAGGEAAVSDEKCEKCGSPLVEKFGRYGKFMACSAYPKCKYIKKNKKKANQETDIACPREDCNGKLTSRMTKKRKRFYSCSNYPDCDYAVWNLDEVEKPEDDSAEKPSAE